MDVNAHQWIVPGKDYLLERRSRVPPHRGRGKVEGDVRMGGSYGINLGYGGGVGLMVDGLVGRCEDSFGGWMVDELLREETVTSLMVRGGEGEGEGKGKGGGKGRGGKGKESEKDERDP